LFQFEFHDKTSMSFLWKKHVRLPGAFPTDFETYADFFTLVSTAANQRHGVLNENKAQAPNVENIAVVSDQLGTV